MEDFYLLSPEAQVGFAPSREDQFVRKLLEQQGGLGCQRRKRSRLSFMEQSWPMS